MHPNSCETDDLPSDPRVQLDNYLYTLLKRRWMVVATTLGVWLVVVIGTFVTPRGYDASALIQVDWGKINIVDEVVVEGDRSRSTNLYATQEKILRSRVLLQRTAEELRLWEHPLFRGSAPPSLDGPPRSREIARALDPMLHVSQVRNTQLMDVGFETPDPELSARLANALVRQYTLFSAEVESDVARDTSTFLLDQVESLRREILENERFLRSYSRENEVIIAESSNDNIVNQRLADLNARLTQAEAERAEAEAYYASIRARDPRNLPEVRNGGSVRELRSRVATLEEEYNRLASRFKDDWPEVRRAKQVLAEARRSLQAETAAESGKVVAAARVAYEAALRRERLLRDSLAAQKLEVENLQRVTAEYEQVRAELKNQREMLQGLLRRRSETDLNADLGERRPVKVRVVEPAEAPVVATTPNVPMNLLVGGVLGVLLAIGIVFVIEYFDDAICTVEDLRRWVPLTYLGMVPRFQPALSAGESVLLGAGGESVRSRRPPFSRSARAGALVASANAQAGPLSSRKILSERMRFLRGSLLLSTPERAPKVILVTSPDQSCGKTFISINLGEALVQLNKTVLLVDADLRNPNLHKVFRYRNRVGLTTALTGQRPLEDGCIMRTDRPNLFLLMSGPKSPNPSELLSSPAMSKVLEACSHHFDFVLLDSAPLLPVFDTHVLSSRSDAVLLVARAGVTSRQAIHASVELVQRVRGKITGVVLNDVDLADYAEQYYYANAQGYDYGSPFEIPVPVESGKLSSSAAGKPS